MTQRLDDQQLGAVAARMLADYDAVNPGSIYDENFRVDLNDAWRIQTAVTRLRETRGEKVIGYKVGAVSPGNQELMGVPHPVWGRLWDTELHDSGASLKKSSFANIAIEAEFGVTLHQPVQSGMTVDEIAGCVDALYPLLELHNLVLRGARPHGNELVANNCIFSGIVRGKPVTDLDDSIETNLKLVFDDVVQDSWESLRWPDDILAAVGWLATSLDEHELSLPAGSLILTGAWGPPIAVGSHTRVDVTASTVGNASASFD